MIQFQKNHVKLHRIFPKTYCIFKVSRAILAWCELFSCVDFRECTFSTTRRGAHAVVARTSWCSDILRDEWENATNYSHVEWNEAQRKSWKRGIYLRIFFLIWVLNTCEVQRRQHKHLRHLRFLSLRNCEKDYTTLRKERNLQKQALMSIQKKHFPIPCKS